MANKITLNPAPTFKLAVEIPVPGADFASVEFVFKHRTKTQLEEMFAKNKAAEAVDQVSEVMEMVVGWEFSEDFNRENVARLLDNYPGSALAILLAYSGELQRFKRGN